MDGKYIEEENNDIEEKNGKDNENIGEENEEDNEKGLLRILGKEFIKNNKNKGKLIINNKRYKLEEYIKIEDNNVQNYKLQMILSKDLSNYSYMFKDCESLIEFSSYDYEEDYDFNKMNIVEISKEEILNFDIDANYNDNSFYKDNPFIDISEITKKEVSIKNSDNSELSELDDSLVFSNNNYTILKGMFFECESLKIIPDLSKLNTKNIVDVSEMFFRCKSLSSLPDISKWRTDNIIYMYGMFNGCRHLISLPDISKWNINNVMDISSIFCD